MFWLAIARIAINVLAAIAAIVASANTRGDNADPRIADTADIIAIRL
jgi:hypothetical protein